MDPIPPAVLYPVYMLVMGGALACFVLAYRARKDTRRHMRLALTGLALDLTGTLVVLLVHRVLAWPWDYHDEVVVQWHRRAAYVSSGLLLLTAFAGWRRLPWHPWLGRLLLPTYTLTLALAIYGYWPY